MLFQYIFNECIIKSKTTNIDDYFVIVIYLMVTLYFQVSLLQCNYTFKYGVILINYMYLLYDNG